MAGFFQPNIELIRQQEQLLFQNQQTNKYNEYDPNDKRTIGKKLINALITENTLPGIAQLATTKIISQEQSTTMSEIMSGVGFKEIFNRLKFQDFDIKDQYLQIVLEKMIKNLEDDMYEQLKHNYVSVIELLPYLHDSRYKEGNIIVNFCDNSGYLKACFIEFKQQQQGVIKIRTTNIDSKFTPANPYVVITESKSESIFCFSSSSSSQHIEYLPATIEDRHWQSIININVGLFNLVSTLGEQDISHPISITKLDDVTVQIE